LLWPSVYLVIEMKGRLLQAQPDENLQGLHLKSLEEVVKVGMLRNISSYNLPSFFSTIAKKIPDSKPGVIFKTNVFSAIPE